MTTTPATRDNLITQVPQPLIHFPPFFPVQVPQKGFSRTSISEYGDLITVSAPETPRVRELVIFLAALTFFEGVECRGGEDRIKMTIPGREWRKRAGLGRTAKEKIAWEQSIKTLAGVQYDVVVGGAPRDSGVQYKKRETPPPFRRVILTGILGDIKFHKDDSVTVSILRDFVADIDNTGLRVSLTHILALRGNVSRLLAYVLYGRQTWLGTWKQLAGLAGINNWRSADWKQRQTLKNALDELSQHGFLVTIGEEKIKIARKKGLLGGILNVNV